MFIVEKEPKSVAAESYRSLRTGIQYSSFDKKYKTILITSSEPGEGKSTTSANLALSLVQSGKKVILIDCDMRRPSVHKAFRISDTQGISDVLVGNVKLEDSIVKSGELYILTAGSIPPNPSEMLESNAMTELLDRLKEEYDYVIIDSPPVQAVTDSQVLSTKVDATILVIKVEKTKKESVRNSIKLLKQVNANIIGTVLNGIDTKRSNYYYYYSNEDNEKHRKHRKGNRFKKRKKYSENEMVVQ